jgi:hypothetical protein
MNYYPINDIIPEVKVALDENVSSDALTALGDLDTLTLDEIIESKIGDAALMVHEKAAHWLLTDGINYPVVNPTVQMLGGGWKMLRTKLPNDFLRIVSVKAQGWDYPVIELIDETSPLYTMQFSRFGGIHGNPQRPVAALVHSTVEGGLALELFGVPAEGSNVISQCIYIARPAAMGGAIRLCEKLKRATVYRAASLVALTVKDGDAAAALLATSNELAGITTAER